MIRRRVAALAIVLLAAVAVARWTVWEPSDAGTGGTAGVRVQIIPPPTTITNGIRYYRPSSRVWPLPRELFAGSVRGQVLGAVEAESVAFAVWDTRERAAAMLDLPMLSQLDTGPALAADAAFLRARRAVGDQTPRPARLISIDSVVVPRETHYPAWFMVRGRLSTGVTTADPQTSDGLEEIAIVERTAPGRPWQLATDTSFDPALAPPAVIGTRRWVVGPPPPDPRSAAGDLRALADYTEYWFNHGVAPPRSAFAPGPGTTGQGPGLVLRGAGVVATRRTQAPYGGRVFTIPLDDGMTLGCGAIRSTVAYVPRDVGGFLWQTSDRRNWGDDLDPGAYSQIHTTAERQACILRRPRGPLAVYGGLPEELNEEGTRIAGTVPGGQAA